MSTRRATALVALLLPATAFGVSSPDPEWRAIEACQFAVMARLPEPQAAQFIDLSRSYRKLVGGAYTVQVQGRFKNKVGQMQLATFECAVDAKTFDAKKVRQVS